MCLAISVVFAGSLLLAADRYFMAATVLGGYGVACTALLVALFRFPRRRGDDFP